MNISYTGSQSDNDPTSSPDSISFLGEQLLLTLCGAPKTTSLNIHRHKQFMKAVAYCPVLRLYSALPPTSTAARGHSFQVYYQVQLPLTEWGWELIDKLAAATSPHLSTTCAWKTVNFDFLQLQKWLWAILWLQEVRYIVITMEMAAAILKKQSFFIQSLMESITLMQKRAKTISVPIH